VAQIAYLGASRDVAHVVVGYAVSVTLCGERASGYGESLPSIKSSWPDLNWCQECVAAYGD
jgi:hypothetical protein